MTTRTRIALSVAAASALGLTIAGCSSSGSSTTTAPPSAIFVVAADGYTASASALTPAELNAAVGTADQGDFSSGAAGFNSSGNAEVVIILTAQGQSDLNAAGGESAIQSQLPSGVSVTISGSVIRIDGTQASLGQLGA